jgi:VWFA-related protein
MVFDKQGQFVNNLRREDFELRIDGEKRPIDFFERISAGSANEESQLAAARGSNSSPKPGSAAVPLDRGRTIFFYIDDIHLDLAGAASTRKMVTQFIEKEMGQNDEAGIASASGQIGFLQQLTDNRAVLKAAIDRLKPNLTSVSDGQRPPMSEYQALLISRYDKDATDYFVDALLREIPMLTREAATSMVMERAQQMPALRVRQDDHIRKLLPDIRDVFHSELVVNFATTRPTDHLVLESVVAGSSRIHCRENDPASCFASHILGQVLVGQEDDCICIQRLDN